MALKKKQNTINRHSVSLSSQKGGAFEMSEAVGLVSIHRMMLIIHTALFNMTVT